MIKTRRNAKPAERAGYHADKDLYLYEPITYIYYLSAGGTYAVSR